MGHLFTFCKTCETPLDCDCCDKLEMLEEMQMKSLEEFRHLNLWQSMAMKFAQQNGNQELKH